MKYKLWRRARTQARTRKSTEGAHFPKWCSLWSLPRSPRRPAAASIATGDREKNSRGILSRDNMRIRIVLYRFVSENQIANRFSHRGRRLKSSRSNSACLPNRFSPIALALGRVLRSFLRILRVSGSRAVAFFSYGQRQFLPFRRRAVVIPEGIKRIHPVPPRLIELGRHLLKVLNTARGPMFCIAAAREAEA